jgi:hypothetical protein
MIKRNSKIWQNEHILHRNPRIPQQLATIRNYLRNGCNLHHSREFGAVARIANITEWLFSAS